MAQISLLDALIQFSQPQQAYGGYQQQPSGWGQVMQGLNGLAQLDAAPARPLEHLNRLAGASQFGAQLYGPAYAQALGQQADPDRGINNAYKQSIIAAQNDPFDRLAKIQQLSISQQNANRLLQESQIKQQELENEQRVLHGLPPISLNNSPATGGGIVGSAALPAPLKALADMNSPLNVRNNNPGNIKDPSTGEFRQFSSPEDGQKAAISDLYLKLSGGSPVMKEKFGEGYTPTIQNVISTWAPASDNNDPKAYAKFVSRETGIPVDQPLSVADATKILPAITKFEGGQKAADYYAAPPQSVQSAAMLPAPEGPILTDLPSFSPSPQLQWLEQNSAVSDKVADKAKSLRKIEREAYEDKVKAIEFKNKQKLDSKPLTEQQAKDSLFADRMLAADPIIDTFAAANTLGNKAKDAIPGIGNFLTGPEFQQFDQARRDFLNAVLRKESGAAISSSEFEQGNKQYFPQPGDSPEVIAQKKKNRATAINGVARGGGKQYYEEFKKKSSAVSGATGGWSIQKVQ